MDVFQTTVLDGLTGVPILNKSIEQSVGAQSSPLTSNFDAKEMQIVKPSAFPVSFKERGHDMFLYWMGECDQSNRNSERKIAYDKSLWTNIRRSISLRRLVRI